MIGFESSTKLWFEGENHYGYGIVPMPIISPATVIGDPQCLNDIPSVSEIIRLKLVFREDFFDPVTRIRRGRFYFNPGSQPCPWNAHWHSFMPSQVLANLQLITFQRWRASQYLEHNGALVALGESDAFTLWRAIGIERISSGDDLVTLRARTSLGLLPELDFQAIPANAKDRITDIVDKAIDAAYRAGADSVIDRCRDAAQACIGAWASHKLSNEDIATLDLSPLLEKIERTMRDSAPAVLLNSARIIARLHARKPNEQTKRGLRANEEGDAEAALVNLGLILRELRWVAE